MFKRSSYLVMIVATAFIAACASKKTETPNVGGAEGGKMDAAIGSNDIGFDSAGSDSGKINGLQTVHFDYDSSNLSAETRKEVASNGDWIKAHPNVTVQIEGHCDARGSVEYNLALGERRAKSVKAYLTTLGIDSKRLTIISYGEEKPIATGDSEEAYAKNRRANFVPLAQ